MKINVSVEHCVPVIPSANLEKSLRFWAEGLGLAVSREMREEGRLIGCMVHRDRLSFWLNRRAGTSTKPDNFEGLRLYWTPTDIHALRERLLRLGYSVSEIVNRDYGQAEFFVTDDDGYSHTFGLASEERLPS
jgi:catechol 2,3-dioxygenase-like lactoylglutathione lyase family enzyme